MGEPEWRRSIDIILFANTFPSFYLSNSLQLCMHKGVGWEAFKAKAERRKSGLNEGINKELDEHNPADFLIIGNCIITQFKYLFLMLYLQ